MVTNILNVRIGVVFFEHAEAIHMKYKNIILMKYGVHAGEDIESIIERKQEEIQVCKKMLWGYGGVLCHPLNQVQPFLNENCLRGEKTYLLLTQTPSKLFNAPSVATDFSRDKTTWEPIPDGIKVIGSKYAIVCSSIRQCNFCIDLSKYTVPIGNSTGKRLSDYIRGRVDKACGRYTETSSANSSIVSVSLCCEIDYPYSVFLR